MDYNNAIFKIKQKNYVADFSVSADNFEQVKSSLFYLNEGNYIPVSSEANFESSVTYYTESNWLQIPMIKGTSARISTEAAETTSAGKLIQGQKITVTNEDLTQPAVSTFYLWNGLDGTGQVDFVDGISPPTTDPSNVHLNAVRYTSQILSNESQLQARKNIGAATSWLEELKVNDVGINYNSSYIIDDSITSDNFDENKALLYYLDDGNYLWANDTSYDPEIDYYRFSSIPSITLTANDLDINLETLGAATSWLELLTVNGVAIDHINSNPSITLAPSHIGAAIGQLELLKVNGIGIANTSTNPSITLGINDLGFGIDDVIQVGNNPVKNTAIHNRFISVENSINNITAKITVYTLPSGGWSAPDSSVPVYIQNIMVNGITVTPNTKVDIQADATTILQMIDDGTNALYVENYDFIIDENATPSLRVYAIGEAPTSNLTVQLSVSKISI